MRFQGLRPSDWAFRGRAHVALYMRRIADKIAPDTTWRYTGLNMRMVKDRGVQVSWRSTGAPGIDLYYREEDYMKRWDEKGEAYDG